MKTGIYKHSKTGNLYRVHFVAKHSETLEDMVVYEALYENPKSKFWVRPRAMFTEEIELDGKKAPRFVFCAETQLTDKKGKLEYKRKGPRRDGTLREPFRGDTR